ncbi:DUF4166 domain-containing protein [Pseudolysinimonas kribbensis]|uniref:DUF4166 domain-containing protein n=1 Tax=Pseudolysinimonas kribbensis TaxID=433641 RepID=A0ABQ6KCM8_9MICO|nr:DUF4166 domain-containing protein [Pseudolysinimonas kribbensis]GMA97053.1 hypothetical protein GCM10025881_38770 [Pseudolysinimonas kribbensis]
MSSPWQRVLGDGTAALHPRLRTYVGQIPEGCVGRGAGVFERVGTPRRWLWPMLAVLGRSGIAFPVWAHDVPFAIENRPDGAVLRARRTFSLPGGDRVMVDAIEASGGVIVDRLGGSGSWRAVLTASIVDGALLLRSIRTSWRGIPVPFAPRVHLTERWDDAVERQHVALTLDAPLVGRLYEYAGHFDYVVEDA